MPGPAGQADEKEARTHLDLCEHLVVPFRRRLEDRGEGGLRNAAGAEEAVGPHRHALLDAVGDVERVVQRDPTETPAGKEEAFGQAGEGDDGNGVGEGSQGDERAGPGLKGKRESSWCCGSGALTMWP
jgi:hypothetical protein